MRYLLLLLILSGCIPKTENTPEAEKRFVFLPKADVDSKPYSLAEKPALFSYPIYIGPYPDTVDFIKTYGFDTLWIKASKKNNVPFTENGYDSSMSFIPYAIKIQSHIVEYDYYAHSNKKNRKDSISIYLDTTQLSSSDRGIWATANRSEKIQFYPVSIKNLGQDTIFFYTLKLVVEAQIENSIWKEASFNNKFRCATGEPLYWFAPGETIVTPIPKFAGSLKTKFRIAYEFNGETYYSQIYHGSLNPNLLR
jgi:hypothetical protein